MEGCRRDEGGTGEEGRETRRARWMRPSWSTKVLTLLRVLVVLPRVLHVLGLDQDLDLGSDGGAREPLVASRAALLAYRRCRPFDSTPHSLHWFRRLPCSQTALAQLLLRAPASLHWPSSLVPTSTPWTVSLPPVLSSHLLRSSRAMLAPLRRLVRAQMRSPALLALASLPPVLADARSPDLPPVLASRASLFLAKVPSLAPAVHAEIPAPTPAVHARLAASAPLALARPLPEGYRHGVWRGRLWRATP